MGACHHCQGTGQSPDSLVRNFEHLNQVVNWGKLAGSLSNPKFYPTDSDGKFDRNGHFIEFEWKRFTNSPGESLPTVQTGQHIHMDMFASNRPENHAVAIWGEPETCSPWVIYDYKTDQILLDLRSHPELTVDQRTKYLGNWFNEWEAYVNDQPHGGVGNNDRLPKLRRDRYESLFN